MFKNFDCTRWGRLKNYVHRGYKSTYEQYLLFEVKKGKLMAKKQFGAVEFNQFKKTQLELFKKTKAYTVLAQKWKDKYEHTLQ